MYKLVRISYKKLKKGDQVFVIWETRGYTFLFERWLEDAVPRFNSDPLTLEFSSGYISREGEFFFNDRTIFYKSLTIFSNQFFDAPVQRVVDILKLDNLYPLQNEPRPRRR